MKLHEIATRSLLLGGILFALSTSAASATQGACCYPDGMCVDSTRDDVCAEAGGTKPGGPSGLCKDITCPQPEGGACTTTADCIDGTGLACVDGTCRRTTMAPTASTTGLLLLIGALAIGGSFAARRRRV